MINMITAGLVKQSKLSERKAHLPMRLTNNRAKTKDRYLCSISTGIQYIPVNGNRITGALIRPNLRSQSRGLTLRRPNVLHEETYLPHDVAPLPWV